ncbi:YciI family protein [Agaribacterium sp. ZY112]|uniref:YciI family protein n=1 Tax=Agaribacterium sp. ZY112 TaxID=3233574 RepID=UPI0035252714
MPNYIISYLGGEAPKNEEEGKAHFAKYMAWLNNLGDAAISPANPFKNTHAVDSDGSVKEGSMTRMNGFSVIAADTMDEALAIAKACPFLEVNGRLEVSELVQMGKEAE